MGINGSIWGSSANYLSHLDVHSRDMVTKRTAGMISESWKFVDVPHNEQLTAIETVAKVHKLLSKGHKKNISKVIQETTLAWSSCLPTSTLWAALAKVSSLEIFEPISLCCNIYAHDLSISTTLSLDPANKTRFHIGHSGQSSMSLTSSPLSFQASGKR